MSVFVNGMHRGSCVAERPRPDLARSGDIFAPRSVPRLPPIKQSGSYRLRIAGLPFVHGNMLPAQRVTILLNGEDVGTAPVRDVCALTVPFPNNLVESGDPMTLTFLFPDAARPSEVSGTDDSRLLGFALGRLALFRVDARRQANERALGRPVLYVGAPIETPPVLTSEWHVGAAD